MRDRLRYYIEYWARGESVRIVSHFRILSDVLMPKNHENSQKFAIGHNSQYFAISKIKDVEEGRRRNMGFSELGLYVQPSKGKADIHFPATTGLEEDLRTEHEGAAAVDDK